jgi:hypothetical protein
MRSILWTSSAVLLLGPLAAFAAQQSDKTPPPASPPATTMPAVAKPAPKESLAEAARKARERKASEAKAKVWDNDNIPSSGAVTTATAAGDSAAPAAADDSAAAAGDEKAWRERFATARAKLKRDQDSLALQQKDFGRLSIQYYPDPQKGLTQSYSQNDLIKAREKIDATKDLVVADQKAISDLEDELRKSGGDPGWERE